MLGNYLLQRTSADDNFRCIFFLGALRVKYLVTVDNIEIRKKIKEFSAVIS